ncbi:MAG: hypothetical protein HY298_02220 [Verrucomicrobia bacterium]|nr:hypothetical protein [Verrucomicrobiota bacterium]
MEKFSKVLIGFELAVLTSVVYSHVGNNALAVSAEADTNPPPANATASRQFSTNVMEVIRLAESGIEEAVILAYVESSQMPFELSADDIVYLKDLGTEPSIIAAMLRQDTVLRDQELQAGVVPTVTNQFTSDQNLYEPPTKVSQAAPEQPAYVTNAPPEVSYFYNTLEPYGTWIELEDFGWCWQPYVVVVNRYWRPYWHGGRWIYTDCGWYWQSDYSWGWAPFHYGRWHRHPRCGWVWFPDRVWAPAWVCWRYSDRHCGWAPLPPGAHFVAGHGFRFNNVSVGINFDFGLGLDLFTFVEIGHVHERHPHLHALPSERVKEIYGQTTVVNNYVVGRNNTIINQGIAVDRVAAASHREIRPVTIKEIPTASLGSVKPDRIEKVGSTSVLNRQELKLPDRAGHVAAQKIDQRHPIVRPMPPRPLIATPPPREQPSRVKPVPPRPPAPTQTPPKREPFGPAAKPLPAPSMKPESPKARETRPSVPRSVPAQRPLPEPRGYLPPQPQPGIPRTRPSPPSRLESPRGREQRLSNLRPIQPSPLMPARPPAFQPTPQKSVGPQQRSPDERKR